MSVDYSVPGRPIGGRRSPSRGSVLRLADFLTGTLPDTPVAADDTTGVQFALDRNDQIGDCVPTGFDNFRRTATRLLTGTEIDTTWDQILAWYRTQNPDFDPAGDPNVNGPGSPADGGMDMQKFLAYLAQAGVILGFAAFDPTSDTEMKAAMWLFVSAYCGATLQVAQQQQTSQGLWDYVPGSGAWGGHCFILVRYTADGRMAAVTWQELVDTTPAWRAHCLEEAYVVLLDEMKDHPGFRQGFDLPKYAAAWQAITGRPFPVPVTPIPPAPPSPPGPAPSPGDLVAAVQALAGDPQVQEWMARHHLGIAGDVKRRIEAVLAAARGASS